MSETTYLAARGALSERLSRYGISQTGTVENDIIMTVLQAIREPDQEMIDRGRDVGPAPRCGAHETIKKWVSMVDAMIAQAPAPKQQPRRPSSTVAVFDGR